MVLAAFCFSKISDRAVLDNNFVHIIIFSIHGIKALFSLFLCCKFYIDVSHHVLTYVVSHYKVKNFSKIAEFPEYFIKKFLKMVCSL